MSQHGPHHPQTLELVAQMQAQLEQHRQDHQAHQARLAARQANVAPRDPPPPPPTAASSSSASSSSNGAAAAAGTSSSSSSSTAPARPTIRFSTRVKGAPSKLLDELIATPAIKKRRMSSQFGMNKKAKSDIERLYAYQQQATKAGLLPMPGMPPLPGMIPGMPPSAAALAFSRMMMGGGPNGGPPGANNAFVLGGYPQAAMAAALTPGSAATSALPATFRPGASAANVHQAHAFPAVPIAPHAMAHDLDAETAWMDHETAHPEDASRSSGEMVTLLASTRCCALTPASFFVAWHGVLTLSFQGFPTPLSSLKAELAQLEQPWALPIEQSGSKWPKLTLACLKEDKKLTLDQLRQLYELTARMREKVASDPWRMAVRELSYVKFGTRSLERLLIRTDVPLKDSLAGRAAAAAAAAGMPGLHSKGLAVDVPADESAKVNTVLSELTAEPGSIETYLPHVNKAGGRTVHYQSPHSESSLVVFVSPARPPASTNSRAPAFLEEFRAQVDQLLPGYYEWFPWNALHVTVRSMA